MSKLDDLLNKSKPVKVEIDTEMPMLQDIMIGDTVISGGNVCKVKEINHQTNTALVANEHGGLNVPLNKLIRNGFNNWRFQP